jgi:glycosyltransferase involved in cell wall biosynthesis
LSQTGTVSKARDLILIHDKLLSFGGAEVVLRSLVSYRKPKVLICSCISDRKYWESYYNVKIETPLLCRFIKNEALFKLMYPYVILVCSLSKLAPGGSRAFTIVYSSSAGKYFRVGNYSTALLYVNFHAKGLKNGFNYLPSGIRKSIVAWLIKILQRVFLRCEDYAVSKFRFIRAISTDAYYSLPSSLLTNKEKNIEVLFCPTVISGISENFNDRTYSNASSYFVIISRLSPEKNIEPLLTFLYKNTDYKIMVVGDGSLRKEFQLNYTDRFVFNGFLREDDKVRLLSNCLALIQPTVQEWSLVTIEANILGIPVIGPRCQGMEEINKVISSRGSEPNLLFEEYSEIPNLVTQLVKSKSLLEQKSAFLRETFSAERFHAKLSDVEGFVFSSCIDESRIL